MHSSPLERSRLSTIGWIYGQVPRVSNKPMTDKQIIKLDQFLKWVGVVATGGQAKLLIQDGHVQVNGQVEVRRGRKLVEGDRVSTMGETFKVQLPEGG